MFTAAFSEYYHFSKYTQWSTNYTFKMYTTWNSIQWIEHVTYHESKMKDSFNTIKIKYKMKNKQIKLLNEKNKKAIIKNTSLLYKTK